METRRLRDAPVRAASLSDLPIRDGNPTNPANCSRLVVFQTFLSGMETEQARDSREPDARFQTFLSGMETISSRNTSDCLRPFQTFLSGMETPGIPWRSLLSPVLSDLPIRDGNMSYHPAGSPSYIFQTFLSGMETGCDSRSSCRPSTFRPSYQGWKPCKTHGPHLLIVPFQTFLSGMETGLSCRR